MPKETATQRRNRRTAETKRTIRRLNKVISDQEAKIKLQRQEIKKLKGGK